MQSIPLDEAAGVTLNAAGVGSVVIGPRTPRQRWHVTNVAVSTSSNTKEPIAEIYLGNVSPSNLLGATYTGSRDSSGMDVWLNRGNVLTARWVNGDAGARATVSLYGDIEVA